MFVDIFFPAGEPSCRLSHSATVKLRRTYTSALTALWIKSMPMARLYNKEKNHASGSFDAVMDEMTVSSEYAIRR